MKDEVLVAGAIVHKMVKQKAQWFLVRESEERGWEVPKTNVRRGESSVRAAIRMMAEQGGMDTKVLEEAGRSGGAAKVKDRLMTQKIYYYLMVAEFGEQELGFAETEWYDYGQAVRKLASKREQGMLRGANRILKDLQKQAERRVKF
jgi:ADP-ribose pyrophosphatase YjhB (NUDIX family)